MEISEIITSHPDKTEEARDVERITHPCNHIRAFRYVIHNTIFE